MKKIKNKRQFFTGTLAMVLAALCLMLVAVDITEGQDGKFVVSGAVFLILSASSFYWAFREKGLAEEIQGNVDERDRMVAMKSCQTMVQIMECILLGGCAICLVLYGATKLIGLLIVAITLCMVLVTMFTAILLVNGYYEKRL